MYCNIVFKEVSFPFADSSQNKAITTKQEEAVPGTKYISNIFIINKYNILYIALYKAVFTKVTKGGKRGVCKIKGTNPPPSADIHMAN